MSLNPRLIAVQGIGDSSRLVAVQGLWPAFRRRGGLVSSSRALMDAQMERLIDEDDALLLLALSCAGGFPVPA